MSALAARRAAAAAGSAQSTPQRSPAPTPSTSTATSARRRTPTTPTTAPVVHPGEPSTAKSSSQRSTKRQRIDPPPREGASYSSRGETRLARSESSARETFRRFSPSRPAINGEEEESPVSGSVNEPIESIESPDQTGDVEYAMEQVDSGRASFSLDQPRPHGRGSLAEPTRKEDGSETTSRFVPDDQRKNCVRISAEMLEKVGFDADLPGPGIVITLKEHESLMIAGTYTLTPISGTIRLCSSILEPFEHQRGPDSHSVFAPTSHPIPVIKLETSAFGRAPRRLNLFPTLCRQLSLPSDCQKTWKSAVFLLREHRSGIDGLRSGAVPGFNNIWLEGTGTWGLSGVHPVIGSFPFPAVYPHVDMDLRPAPFNADSCLAHLATRPEHYRRQDLDHTWSSETERTRPPVILVRGPKRSGKSTMARAAINRLLQAYEKVAWLECDLGQGEFGCGGVVGLWVIHSPVFGPSFTHPLVPLRAHYLGTYTPLSCPDEYISAIRHLLEYFQEEIQIPSTSKPISSESDKIIDCVPLVINTQGWVKGLGQDLLRQIDHAAEPTFVLDFKDYSQPARPDEDQIFSPPPWHSTDPRLPRHAGRSTGERWNVHVIEAITPSPLQARYTAADLRILSTISYFQAQLGQARQTSMVATEHATWDFSTPIVAMSPWQVEIGPNGPLRKVFMTGEGSEGIVEEDLPLALNGSIVALVEIQNVDTETPCYVQSSPLPPLDIINTLGLGLIRAIQPSFSGYTIHVLTPLPPHVLSKIDGMVVNRAMELPLVGMLDWKSTKTTDSGEKMMGWDWEDVPFLEVGEMSGVGGEKRRYRRNLMRKGM